MNTQIVNEEIKAMAARLRELFPNTQTVIIDSSDYKAVEVKFFNQEGASTYEDATELMRSIGFQKREKSVCGESLCTVDAVYDGVKYSAFANTLPPTCRIEKYTEKIPNMQTVTTGEFIEVERTRVVCGDKEVQPA